MAILHIRLLNLVGEYFALQNGSCTSASDPVSGSGNILENLDASGGHQSATLPLSTLQEGGNKQALLIIPAMRRVTTIESYIGKGSNRAAMVLPPRLLPPRLSDL